MILQATHSVSSERRFLDAAIDLVRATAMNPSIPVAIRLGAAQAWGEWAGREISGDRTYLSQAAEGYAIAVSLLPTLAWRGFCGHLRSGHSQRGQTCRAWLPPTPQKTDWLKVPSRFSNLAGRCCGGS